MSYCRFVSVVLGAAVAALASIHASAGGMDRKEIVANVAFAFYIGDTSFPAGSYNVSAMNMGADSVMIRPSGGEGTTTLPVIMRLAQPVGSPQATARSLVFDKVGDRSYLSEVWIPGRDGYLVRAITETDEEVLARPVK